MMVSGTKIRDRKLFRGSDSFLEEILYRLTADAALLAGQLVVVAAKSPQPGAAAPLCCMVVYSAAGPSGWLVGGPL